MDLAGHEDFTAMMQTWAVVEDLPEVVNAEVGDAIEELTQVTLIPHAVAVQTDEVRTGGGGATSKGAPRDA